MSIVSKQTPLSLSDCKDVTTKGGGQAPITCPPQIVKSNIDTLHLSLWCDLSNSKILSEIETARNVARELEVEKVPFIYFSTNFNVHRSGRRHFTFHISTGDTHIFFNKRDSQGSFPTCIIEIGSLSSWCPNPFKTFDNIRSFFSFSGVKIVKHNVSRVDLASDFIGTNYSKLDLGNNDKWIRRATIFGCYYSGRKQTGVSIGKGDTMLRVYDKTQELLDKGSKNKEKFFRDVWSSGEGNPYKDQVIENVTRVEFQFRRNFLKDFEYGGEGYTVQTLSDLKKALNGLWAYASEHWARHCSKEVDFENNNQKQSKESDFWLEVQQASFNDYSSVHIRKKRKVNHLNVDALLEQATGCIMAASSSVINSPDNIEAIIRFSRIAIKNWLIKKYSTQYEKFILKMRTSMNSNHSQFAL